MRGAHDADGRPFTVLCAKDNAYCMNDLWSHETSRHAFESQILKLQLNNSSFARLGQKRFESDIWARFISSSDVEQPFS